MKLESNYEKCVILNDLQRQLEYKEIKIGVHEMMSVNVWDIWYNGVYFGYIQSFKHVKVGYRVVTAYHDKVDTYPCFMEALAVFVDEVVKNYEEPTEDLAIPEHIDETPEKTIWEGIKNYVKKIDILFKIK